MAVISVSLPDDLLAQADRFIKARGWSGRSELVRAALREFINRHTSAGRRGARAATLTLVYPEGNERKVGAVRHDHSDVVKSMMHGHTSHSCVEVFVLEGDGERIQAFADALQGVRDTRLVELTYTDAAAPAEHAH